MLKIQTRKKQIKSIIRKIKVSPSWQGCVLLSALLLFSSVSAVSAQTTLRELSEASINLKVGLDTLWVVVASILVIFMNAGFAMLETGFCRRKNAVNLLSKNLIVFAISTLAFWGVGFALMFGDGNNIIGSSGFFLNGSDNSPATGDAYVGVYNALNWTGVPLAAKFLFQVAFAGTAATIVSGAVAERIKFIDFLLFSFFLVAFAYPLIGHWIWGGGDIRGLLTTGDFSLFGVQIIGIFGVALTMTIFSFLFWYVLKITFGLRVSEEEEYLGLDIGEHGMEAYNGFLDEMEME
ncbi:MAG: hypothetical protein IGQ45_04265 [Cyanobacterium sp. T60_A2020_053]|nr:hypothetical protein [Cyanobacterium sp. T60_A2020_053]